MTSQRYRRIIGLEEEPAPDKSKRSDAYYDSEPIEETIRKLVRETVRKYSQQ